MSKKSREKARRRAKKKREKKIRKVGTMADAILGLIPGNPESATPKDPIFEQVARENGFHLPGIKTSWAEIKKYYRQELDPPIYIYHNEKGIFKSADPNVGEKAAEFTKKIGLGVLRRHDDFGDDLAKVGVYIPRVGITEKPRLPEPKEK